MSLVKRNNLVFPSLMNEIFKPDWFGGIENGAGRMPAVNILENDSDFSLELSVPGMKKEDFSIEVDKDVLTVFSEMKSEDVQKDDHYTRREFVTSSFKRSFTLPDTIDTDNINAKYEAGILKLMLPKKEEALPKPKRQITLS